MLKKRVITAAILIPLVLAAILYLDERWFAVASGVFFILGCWEWATLTAMQSLLKKIVYMVVAGGIMGLSRWVPYIWIYVVALLWWMWAIFIVCRFPKDTAKWTKFSWFAPLVGLLVLIPCWVAINKIRILEHGVAQLIVLFVIVWGADSGAYFAGKKWGSTPLAPAVSPGKTVEGFLGGFLCALLLVGLMCLWKKTFIFEIPFYLILVCMAIVISVFGDLFESVVKRVYGVKDSGNMLPGHGGILDRIDALTAAAPLFGLGLWLLGYH